jgi:hypothetical protein
LQKCRKKKLRLFFSWFDRWIVQYFLTLKILYIYWNVRMNEGKRWKLLVDGGVGFVASAIVFATSRRPALSGHHSYDRQVVDPRGRSTEVHEEVH